MRPVIFRSLISLFCASETNLFFITRAIGSVRLFFFCQCRTHTHSCYIRLFTCKPDHPILFETQRSWCIMPLHVIVMCMYLSTFSFFFYTFSFIIILFFFYLISNLYLPTKIMSRKYENLNMSLYCSRRREILNIYILNISNVYVLGFIKVKVFCVFEREIKREREWQKEKHSYKRK